MKLLNTYEYEIKKSKFISYLYEIDEKEEVKEIREEEIKLSNDRNQTI